MGGLFSHADFALCAQARPAASAAVMAVAVKSSAAIRVLTTVAMAKAVQHHAVHDLKAVAPPVA